MTKFNDRPSLEEVTKLIAGLPRETIEAIVRGDNLPDPTAEVIADRQKIIAKCQAAAQDARQMIRNAGPDGLRAGPVITSIALEHALDIAQVVKVVSALEIVGWTRTVGWNQLVSTELDPPTETVATPKTDATLRVAKEVQDRLGGTPEPEQPSLTPGRHDRGWPKGEKALTPCNHDPS